MDVSSGEKRCIKHESLKDVIVHGHFSAAEPATHQISIVVKDTRDHLLYKQENISKGTFAFSTEDYDFFEACFISRPNPAIENPSVREVYLDIKHGAEAKNFNLLAKAEKLQPVESELKRLEALAEEITQHFSRMHVKSAKIRYTNESTHNRVLYFSLLSMVILVGFACWQVLYLRRYFKSKKLIE